ALFKKNAMLKTIAPDKNNQKPTAFKYGNAKSRAPICRGMAIFMSPNSIGIAAKKIIMVPCVVKTSLYLSAWNTQKSLLGEISCIRINNESIPARKKNIKPNNIYIVPIFRWLEVLINSQITGSLRFFKTQITTKI